MKKLCPICKSGYEHILNKRRLGCAFCYFVFKTEMHYVFQEKQDNKHVHLGKKPKNFTNPINIFINNLIENKIEDEMLKHELKKAINLNNINGD